MMKLIGYIFSFILAVHVFNPAYSQSTHVINKVEYKEKLKGFWLGSCIANWTGLRTESLDNQHWYPYYTDDDWGTNKGIGGQLIDYVLNQDPWQSDDDTDIEYIFQHALETYATSKLTGEQIRDQWLEHISPLEENFLWVSNESAFRLMNERDMVPPATSDPSNNPNWEMIDAQLTTEIFGFFAPANYRIALDISYLPIRTTAYDHSMYAAQFYVLMYSYASIVDRSLPIKDQVFWLAEQARLHIPDNTYIGHMYDWVLEQYNATSDKDDWESVRDNFHYKFIEGQANGYQYRNWFDSGSNFGFSIISLLFGEGDFKRTVRIGTLCGMDADNPTATWGGLLGFLYGFDGLKEHFDGYEFSERYNIARTRIGFGGAGTANQYDTYDGNTGEIEEHYGYTFSSEKKIDSLVFQEGQHFWDGGFFADGTLRIQVQQNDSWNDVEVSIAPTYPNGHLSEDFGDNFEIYTFRLNEKGTGIRIIGDAGGSAHFVSIAELMAFENGVNLAIDGTIVGSVLNPSGGGNKDIEIIRNGELIDTSYDSFTSLAERGLTIIDRVVAEQMGGVVSEESWIIQSPVLPLNVLNGKDQKPVLFHPNPASDFLHVEGFNNEIKTYIYSLTGQLLLMGVGKKINISGLTEGIYLVELKDLLSERFLLRDTLIVK